MKNIIALALLLTVISFTSCSKKKNVAPQTTSNTSIIATDNKINVQYRVTSSTGQINVEYATVAEGTVTTVKTQVSRYTFSYTFDWTKGQKLSVRAYNSTPANKEVLVEIYVNGELFKSGKADLAGAIASAEGVFN